MWSSNDWEASSQLQVVSTTGGSEEDIEMIQIAFPKKKKGISLTLAETMCAFGFMHLLT